MRLIHIISTAAAVGILLLLLWCWFRPPLGPTSLSLSPESEKCVAQRWLLDRAERGDRNARVALIGMADVDSATDWRVANAVAVYEALGNVAKLRSLTEAADPRLRCLAAQALGRRKDTAAIAALVRLTTDETLVEMTYQLPVKPGDDVAGSMAFMTTVGNAARDALVEITGRKPSDPNDRQFWIKEYPPGEKRIEN